MASMGSTLLSDLIDELPAFFITPPSDTTVLA
jgi:hypothetical protein